MQDSQGKSHTLGIISVWKPRKSFFFDNFAKNCIKYEKQNNNQSVQDEHQTVELQELEGLTSCALVGPSHTSDSQLNVLIAAHAHQPLTEDHSSPCSSGLMLT